jgi:hypothetical protein
VTESTKLDNMGSYFYPGSTDLLNNCLRSDDKSKESKCGVEKPAATESSKSKVSLEEAKVPDKHKADVGGDDNDESDEDVDSEDGESGDDEVGISEISFPPCFSVFSHFSRLFCCDTSIKN